MLHRMWKETVAEQSVATAEWFLPERRERSALIGLERSNMRSMLLIQANKNIPGFQSIAPSCKAVGKSVRSPIIARTTLATIKRHTVQCSQSLESIIGSCGLRSLTKLAISWSVILDALISHLGLFRLLPSFFSYPDES